METIEALLFDADGTLVDSEELGLDTLRRQALRAGAALSEADIAGLRGQSMAACLQAVARRRGRPLPADFEARLREEMAAVFERELRPMPGAAALLAGLVQRAVPLCVATNGPRAKVELTLRLTGLAPFVAGRIFCAPEVGAFKPDPELFLAAAQALGVAPHRCAVVEDSEPGMEAGLRAGMRVFAVRTVQPMPPALADRIHQLDRLEDLLDLVPTGTGA
ncbi:MAG: hypothetical protein QG612_1468 [Pseudomonadota bacterium]|nr:hypothetical protein [Pseudomonadota bacterium]